LGEGLDAAILQTDHTEYRTLDPSDLPGCKAIVDGRGLLNEGTWTALYTALAVIGVG
jgi:UDP-N-acetyl-D-mannosaminuronate dehydrogenase